MNNDDIRETKIINIDNLDIITNGSLKDMDKITNPNQIGQVIYKDNNEVKSDINPIIMIINQGLKDYKERLKILVNNGGDLDMKINYYNIETTPRILAEKYRNY